MFTVNVKNRGQGTAVSSILAGAIDGAALYPVAIGRIYPGDTAAGVFTWVSLSGNHTIVIKADAAGGLDEFDENNNKKSLTISVLPVAPAVQPVPSPKPEAAPAVLPPTAPPAKAPTTPAVTGAAKASDNASGKNTPREIPAGIAAPPPAWQSMLQSRWFIIGVGVIGAGSIGVLLVLRKKAKKSSQ